MVNKEGDTGIETTITKVLPAVGNRPVRVVLAYNGKEHAVFDEGLAGEVRPGLSILAMVSSTVTEKNGRRYTNYYLNNFSVSAEQPVPEVAQPSGGVQDMMVSPSATADGTVPQEVWEAKDRARAMESAIHSAALILQAHGVGVLIQEITGTEGQASILALADVLYNHIQEARYGDSVIIHTQVRAKGVSELVGTPLTPNLDTDSPIFKGAPVPEMNIPTLRKALGWSLQDYLKYLADTYGYKADGPGLTREQMTQIKADLQAKVQASGS